MHAVDVTGRLGRGCTSCGGRWFDRDGTDWEEPWKWTRPMWAGPKRGWCSPAASLLKRWLLGTNQRPVRPEHLDYYLDECTFRFNRRKSASRGKLFYRLVQEAVAVEPVPYQTLIEHISRGPEPKG